MDVKKKIDLDIHKVLEQLQINKEKIQFIRIEPANAKELKNAETGLG